MATIFPSLRGSGLKAYAYLGALLLGQGKILQAAHVYKNALSSTVSSRTAWSHDLRPEHEYIVNHEYRFVYCPIPKVACSSLKRVMVELCSLRNTEEILRLPNDLFHTYIHHNLSLSSYIEDEALSFLRTTNYFKFAFVRNPWSRLVSAYLNKFVEAPSFQNHTFIPDNAREVISACYQAKDLQPDFQKMITFRQFLNYISKTPDDLLDGHWKPQYLFLSDYAFDFIGRLENLEDDFETLREKLNLPVSIPWSNKTSSKHSTDDSQQLENLADFYPTETIALTSPSKYQQFYTPDLIDLVRNRYEEDIKRFGYKF
ncbi:MAG: sulfotransferase family protein [Cyanobacteria bacterium P01_H01_bin.21]